MKCHANLGLAQFSWIWVYITEEKPYWAVFLCVTIPGGLTILEQTDASYAYGYLKSTTSRFDPYASRPADSKGGFVCAGKYYRGNIQNY